jgi:hypothetical protein
MINYQKEFNKKYNDLNDMTLIYLYGQTQKVIRCLSEHTGANADNINDYVITYAKPKLMRSNITHDSLAEYLREVAKRKPMLVMYSDYLKYTVMPNMPTGLLSQLENHLEVINNWNSNKIIHEDKIAHTLLQGKTIEFIQDLIPYKNYIMKQKDQFY